MREKGRYKFSKVHSGPRYGLFHPGDIDLTDATSYTVKEGDIGRFDLLAYQFYDDPSLWWVIAWVNGIANTFDVEIGKVLTVPTREAVATLYASE